MAWVPVTPSSTLARERVLAVAREMGYAPHAAARTLEKGAEMGRFQLGSTVILLFPRHTVRLDDGLVAGAPLRMGQRIGTWL